MTTEKLTLTKTVSSERPTSPSASHNGDSEPRPPSDPFDGLLDDLDEDEVTQPVDNEAVVVGAPRTISEEHLHTDPTIGLTDDEVSIRRKLYGWNQMKEENRSHLKRFASFFVGPIQFVMEVRLMILR